MAAFINSIARLWTIWGIVLLNAIIYIAAGTLSQQANVYNLALNGDASSWAEHPWSLVSYMFVHLSPTHLTANMLLIIAGGVYFLKRETQLSFLATYFIGGVLGSISFLIYSHAAGADNSILCGASAGICSIIAANIVIGPIFKIKIGNRNISISRSLLLLIFTSVIATGVFSQNSGGALAHVTGTVAGMLCGRVLIKLKNKKDNGNLSKSTYAAFADLTDADRRRIASTIADNNK